MAVSAPRNGTAQTSAGASRLPTRIDALLQEYVAGGAASAWYGRSLRALPHPIDDLSTDLGSDIYEKMCLDPQVASALSVLKAGILEDGLSLAPAKDDDTAPDYALAVEIRDEAEAMLDALPTPLDDALWDMLNALAVGNKVAELTYALRPGLAGRELLQLAGLKPKPRERTAFVVDAYGNVLGLLYARPGELSPSLSGALLGQAPDPARPGGATDRENPILPREKFAVLTFRPRDADPRGTSILRPVYAPWWRKWQVVPEYLKYLAQFAGPSLVGYTAPDAVAVPATAGLVNPDDPSAATLTPEQALLVSLLAFRNASALALPAGSKVDPIQSQGDGSAFTRAIADCNREITRAILTQDLATEEGTHQARAAAQVHQDVLDTLVRQGKKSVVRMLARDILRPWVAYNWGPRAAALVPVPSLGTTEEQDKTALMNAVANLQRAGYPHPSQYPAIDQMLGLPVRDMTQDADAEPEPEPAGPPGGDADVPDDDNSGEGEAA